MRLRFNAPLNVPIHFNVPADNTPWFPQVHAKNTQGWTPIRPRATFGTWGRGLDPIGTFSHWDGLSYSWNDVYGIYLFAADLPRPSLYIGIASNDTSKPEGVLVRLKKHRVKATGSHVGSGSASTGGVHHPESWRDFAIQRFGAFGGVGDVLNDVRVGVAMLEGSPIQCKADLERFEKAIIENQGGVLDAIVAKLWPRLAGSGQIRVINGASRGQEGGAHGSDCVIDRDPQDEAITPSDETIQISSEDQVVLW